MYTRQQLSDMTIRPVTHDSGSRYPCDPAHLASYRQYVRIRPSWLVYPSEAMQELVACNSEARRREDFSHRELTAMVCLSASVKIAATGSWTPDVIIKMFADLDLVFFNGRLLGNVYVRWDNTEREISGETVYVGSNRASIRLNSYRIFRMRRVYTSFKLMVATMLHEMCVSEHPLLVHPVTPLARAVQFWPH